MLPVPIVGEVGFATRSRSPPISVGDTRASASATQVFPECPAIVGFICDDADWPGLRTAPDLWYPNRCQGRLSQLHLGILSGAYQQAERQPPPIDYRH